MGYYITLREVDFSIKQENKAKALELFRSEMLAHVDELGGGGRYEKGGKVESWFSWTFTEKLNEAKTIEEVMTQFGWYPELDENGNIISLDFGTEKIGDEEILFNTIAPTVEPNSYIELEGEEGNIWRWYFDGDEMFFQEGRVVFDTQL